MSKLRTVAWLLSAVVVGGLGCSDGVGPQAAGPSQLQVASGDGQDGPVGSLLPHPLVVRVTDVRGNAVSGVEVTWSVLTGGGAVSPTTSSTDGAGEASTIWTLGTGAGENQVSVRVGELSATFTATALPGEAATLEAVSEDGQEGTAGSSLSDPLIVRVTDTHGNPATGIEVSWSVLTGGGSVSPATSSTDGAGEATTIWTLGTGAGENQVKVKAGEFTVTFTAMGLPGEAAILEALGGDGQDGAVGSLLPDSLVVRVTDAHGNAVSEVEVRWSVLTGGGSVSAPTSSTDGVGQTSTVWTLGTDRMMQSLKAAMDGAEPVTFGAVAHGEDFPVRIRDQRISLRRGHTCALNARGTAFCWGLNDANQLGVDYVTSSTTPVPVTGGHAFVQIDVGEFFTMALTAAGEVFTWGSNVAGQLGIGGPVGARNSQATPQRVQVPGRVVQIGVGGFFALALTDQGRVYSWGANNAGQLGDGTTVNRSTPVEVIAPVPFARVATGRYHSLALTDRGAAYAWGENGFGQLGDGTTVNRDRPVAVAGGMRLIEISGGYAHSAAISMDGYAYGWGWGVDVGDGTREDRSTPTRVSGDTRFEHIAAGNRSTLAIAVTGESYAWGWAHSGSLGIGAETGTVLTPRLMSGGHAFRQFSTGHASSVGVTGDGRVLGWGWNGLGQLGDGTQSTHRVPSPGLFNEQYLQLQSVGIEPGATILDAGASLQLTAVLTDVDGRRVTGRPVAWTSSREDVARVTPNGLIYGMAGGGPESIISATSENLSGTATVSVNRGGFNLVLDGVYLTQAVQRYAADVPLIRGHDALLRVFVRATEFANSAAPPVRVRLYRDGDLVETVTLTRNVSSTPAGVHQGDLDSSYNMMVPADLVRPGLAVLVDVDPDATVSETSRDDNVFPRSGEPMSVPVWEGLELGIRFIPIRLATGEIGDVSDESIPAYMDATMKVWPLSGYSADLRTPFTSAEPASALTEMAGHSRVISEIRALRVLDANPRYYHGIVPFVPGSGVGGMAYLGYPVAITVEPAVAGRYDSRSFTVAHEIGHNFNILHAPCGQPSGLDAHYPVTTGALDAFGFDRSSGMVMDPATHYDLMSYCGPRWVSAHNYLAAMEFLDPTATMAYEGPQARNVPEPALLLWGRIPAAGEPVLEPVFELDAVAQLPDGEGPFRIEGLDSAGTTLFSFAFQGSEVAHLRGEWHFSFAIPLRLLPEERPAVVRLVAGDAVVTQRTGEFAGPSRFGERITVPRTFQRRVRGGGTELLWDAERHPMVLVRDAARGEVLSFGRGGRVHLPTTVDLELTFSDGARSATIRVPR
jgi:alpha-tubulin suppressor-like RCC1 family protein